jgi:hypothetical protein
MPFIFLQLIQATTTALNTTPFITVNKATTCFGTMVTSSGVM